MAKEAKTVKAVHVSNRHKRGRHCKKPKRRDRKQTFFTGGVCRK